MKLFVLGLLVWFALMSPGSARSEEGPYYIVPPNAGMREFLGKQGDWQMCGEYFAAVETEGDKTVYFTYADTSAEKLVNVIFIGPIDPGNILFNREITVPLVIKDGARLFILMNVERYLLSLPCLATRGTDA